jgi:integrase
MAVRQLKKTGKWMATVYRGYEQQADGTLKKRANAKCFDTKKQAMAWERGQQNALDDGSWVPPHTKTVSQFLSEWEEGALALGPQSERTKESYGELLRLYVLPHLGSVKLATLTKPVVERMAAKLVKQPVTSGGKVLVPKEGEPVQMLSPVTVRRALAALSVALNAAVAQRLLATNPAQKITLPRAPRKRIQWLTREQRAVLIAGSAEDRHGALWHTLADSGLRPGEALGLAWAHVDLDAGVIRVMRAIGRKKKDAAGRTWRLDDPKTATSRRAVPIGAALVQALLRHRDRQTAERLVAGDRYRTYEDGGFVFAGELGEPMREDALLQVFHRTLARLGLPRVSLYSLRHAHATWLLEGGTPLKTVSERLGHSSIVLTADVYSHVSAEFQRHAVEQLEAYLLAAPTPAREREA